MLRLTALLTATSLLALSSPAGAQPAQEHPPCSVHMQITDEDGAAISRAYVLIHGHSGINQQVAPGPGGKIKVSLRSGLYDLFVSSPGFVPVAQILDLRSCKPLNLNLMLTIDSEHIENDGP